MWNRKRFWTGPAHHCLLCCCIPTAESNQRTITFQAYLGRAPGFLRQFDNGITPASTLLEIAAASGKLICGDAQLPSLVVIELAVAAHMQGKEQSQLLSCAIEKQFATAELCQTNISNNRITKLLTYMLRTVTVQQLKKVSHKKPAILFDFVKPTNMELPVPILTAQVARMACSAVNSPLLPFSFEEAVIMAADDVESCTKGVSACSILKPYIRTGTSLTVASPFQTIIIKSNTSHRVELQTITSSAYDSRVMDISGLQLTPKRGRQAINEYTLFWQRMESTQCSGSKDIW